MLEISFSTTLSSADQVGVYSTPEGAAHAVPRSMDLRHQKEQKSPPGTDSVTISKEAKRESAIARSENATSSDANQTDVEQRKVKDLKMRDRQVRAHEQAHLSTAGSLAKGGVSFEYQTGPDGKRYAVGGEVSIDTTPVKGDPEATIQKAGRIRAAAMAPADPSAQDRIVAAEADTMAVKARLELTQQNNQRGENEKKLSKIDLRI